MDINAFNNVLKEYVTPERWENMQEVLAHRTKHITVVLEDFFQPHNYSAVLRSCDIFGVQDVHIIENEFRYKTNPQVNMGSDKWIDIHRFKKKDTNNTPECFEALKKKGYKIIAAHPHESDVSLFDLDINQPTAIVFGTEKKGISDYVKENADGFMKIPMYGFTESFNVSVSAALTLSNLKHRLNESTNLNWQLTEEEKVEILNTWYKRHVKGYEFLKAEYLKGKLG